MPTGRQSARDGDPEAVFRRLERFYIQMKADQLDAAMDLYAPDAQLLLSGQAPVAGKIPIRNWWQATLKEYKFSATPRLVEATDVGDAVILQGEALGELVSRIGGDSLKVDIWFVQIYRQLDGEFLFWRGASGPNPASGAIR